MQTEREREAKEFRARGAEMAVTITSTADKEVTVILANAMKQSEIMKGEGDGQRNKIFAAAFGKDPEFFSFYRAMQAYETALIGGETSLIIAICVLLSSDSNVSRLCLPKTLLILELIMVANLDRATLSLPTEI